MVDFPLPDGLNIDQFVKNVNSAITGEGIRSDVEFFAYTSSDSFNYGRYLENRSFSAVKVVGKRSRFYSLLHCMVNWLNKRQHYRGKKSLFVIAKDMPGEDNDNMISFLDELMDRGHHVFTVVPDGCLPENFDYPEPIVAWNWFALCSGNKAIDLASVYPTDDDDDDSRSSSPEIDRTQGVKRASETDDVVSSATKRQQKDAHSQN